MENEKKEVQKDITISEEFFNSLVSSLIQGQSVATRLDSVIRYVASEEYPKREMILTLAGINLQNQEGQGQFSESSVESKEDN